MGWGGYSMMGSNGVFILLFWLVVLVDLVLLGLWLLQKIQKK